MAIYTYKKEQFNASSGPAKTIELDIFDSYALKKRLTIWDIFGKVFEGLTYITYSSTIANLIIPTIFISLGFYFIFIQFKPDIKNFIQEQNGILTQGTISLVDEEYIDLSEYISNPAGLSDLTRSAFDAHVLKEDKISSEYNGIFYLTIPALKFYNMPVQANVDSTNEDSYMKVLDNSLAHFEGTGLPISDVLNNIVVYGHSASDNYHPERSDPMVAFSFLSELKVGDDIYINIEGKDYHYKMYKSQIVSPDSVEIITGTPGKRTLTLFTCWEPGNNTSRLVILARPV